MTAFSELILLVLSFGALSSNWNEKYESPQPFHEEDSNLKTPELNYESKSLYDLMANFPTDEGIQCPGSDSRFRYPGECSRYITCRDYRAHIRSCPPGMMFDTKSGHCRLAFEVDCLNIHPTLCGPFEEHSDCGCDKACVDYFEVDDLCEGQCSKGCFCRTGYVRNIDGNCVKSRDCENNVLHLLRSDNH